MKTVDYLDAMRKQLKLPSDYALRPILGVSESTMQNYRHGRTAMDEKVALRAAELLGIDPAKVVLDMAVERAKPEVRGLWKRIAKVAEGVGFEPTVR